MQKIRFVLVSLLCGFSFITHAQFVITGSVLDSSTREPLTPASVFCQNTTLGTVTNKQGEFSIALKSGGYDLIFSYTGYQTQTIRVTENSKLEVLMVKEDKSLGEVVLKKVLLSTKPSRFRYSFFWSDKVKMPPTLSTLFLPQALREKASLIWENPVVTWRNRAY